MMECRVCSNKFNKTNFAPRILKCGHSICHSCLCLMHKNLKFNYTCDICGETYPCTMTDCPPNFAIIDMITPESDPSTEKCPSHDRELTKFCKLCKVPTCDLCNENEHSAKFGCQECSLYERLKCGFDADAIHHLTRLANAYKMKKLKIEKSIQINTYSEVAFEQSVHSCIRKDQSFLEHHLKDVESLLAKINSLINKKEFTTIAEYSNYEKQLQLFNKFDANVDNVCNIGCHTSCNVLLENWMSIRWVIRDILTRNKEAYFSFEGDNYRRIIKKDGAIWVNLHKTENVFSTSELPANSLRFKGESCPYYTFLIKFAKGGGEIRLNVDLRNIGSEILQEFLKTLKNGRNSCDKFTMFENALFLGSGGYSRLCFLTSSNRKMTANPGDLFDEKLNGLDISASELKVDGRAIGYLYSAEIKEKGTEINERKLAILGYNSRGNACSEFYFMKCGIGFIGDGLILIGYHDMEIVKGNVDVVEQEWSTELEIL